LNLSKSCDYVKLVDLRLFFFFFWFQRIDGTGVCEFGSKS
jgi:hypothetical protein